jgi:hypothetical protein
VQEVCGVCGCSGAALRRFAKLLCASDFCGEVVNQVSNGAAIQSSMHGASDPGEVRPKQCVHEHRKIQGWAGRAQKFEEENLSRTSRTMQCSTCQVQKII